MLGDTLVIWGGEFGHTPYARADGRDHNHRGFTGGQRRREGRLQLRRHRRDGIEAVSGAASVDWHATILHLMGLDHDA